MWCCSASSLSSDRSSQIVRSEVRWQKIIIKNIDDIKVSPDTPYYSKNTRDMNERMLMVPLIGAEVAMKDPGYAIELGSG